MNEQNSGIKQKKNSPTKHHRAIQEAIDWIRINAKKNWIIRAREKCCIFQVVSSLRTNNGMKKKKFVAIYIHIFCVIFWPKQNIKWLIRMILICLTFYSRFSFLSLSQSVLLASSLALAEFFFFSVGSSSPFHSLPLSRSLFLFIHVNRHLSYSKYFLENMRLMFCVWFLFKNKICFDLPN